MMDMASPANKAAANQPKQTQGDFSGGVFISYRRSLAGGHAGQLHRRLTEQFGHKRVFIDERTDAIPKGADFPAEIDAALRRAHVILIVIAPDWVRNILERSTWPDVDWVLHETEIALERRQSPFPPAVHVVLVGGAAMPKKSELPEAISVLADINAHVLEGQVWDDKHHGFNRLLSDVIAAVPHDTSPLVIESLAESCARKCLLILSECMAAKVLEDLHEKWQKDFNPLGERQAVDFLVDFNTFIEDHAKQLKKCRSISELDELIDDCVAVVAELLLLGSCQLVIRHDVMGDFHRPAEVESLATQLFAVACSQQRRVRIRFERGSLCKQLEIPLERTLDQNTVMGGILKDANHDVLDQLWNLIPRFKGLPKGNPDKNPEDLKNMVAAFRLMKRSADSLVTVALKGVCSESSGARELRRFLAERRLDVDVLVRTGKSKDVIADLEKELIMAAWFCLQQIEGISGEQSRK